MPPRGYEPFLAAIRAAPADDTPRLVYADWLDEHDDPDRAEFIRLQCELARYGRLGVPTDVSERLPQLERSTLAPAVPLLLRQAELWAVHGEGWEAELPDGDYRVEFHRGFAGAVTPSAARWVHLGRWLGALFAAAPVDRLVLHRGTLLAAEAMLSAPWADRLRSVLAFPTDSDGAGRPDPTEPAVNGFRVAVALGAADRLTRLEELCLPGLRVGDAGANALARARWAKNLRRLDLSNNQIGNRGAGMLAMNLDPARLEVLDLSGNPVTPLVAGQLRERFGGKVYISPPTDHPDDG